jgi:Protein of unknown function (DUF3298)
MHLPIRAILASLTLLVAGCSSGTPPVSSTPQASPTVSPPAQPASSGICSEVGGTWDQAAQVCSVTRTNPNHTTVKVTAKYPVDLVDDPATGPPLKDFLRKFFGSFPPTADWKRDVTANLTYETYRHGPDVKSVVFHDDYDVGGAHPVTEIDTFTFDLKNKKQLALADLFCSGVDPLKALPPLARPFVEREWKANATNAATDISEFEPDGTGANYAENYKAWYLDNDDLVLVMPASRMGPVAAGMWQPQVPFSALRPIMPDGGCSG